MTSLETSKTDKNKLSITFDTRIIIVILLATIAAMLIMWKPWNNDPKSTDRTIQVVGKATLKAEPDEFVFSPYYKFESANKQTGLAALSKKSDKIISRLKELGVADNKIKTNADGYDRGYYYPDSESSKSTYSLSLTIKVNSKDIAQKVQDYLVSTSPSGTVTPYPSFSDSKQKELEGQARDQAEKDAKSKAEQSAQNIGFSLGKVKSISEKNGFGSIQPYMSYGTEDAKATNSSSGLTVQPGENDLSYQINVIYFIK